MTPRRVLDSVAWKSLSLRARAILQVFQCEHDGWSNGHLGIRIHDLGLKIGDQNHGANGRAVAELIDKGFLEITAEADRRQGKVREYRITFVTTGKARELADATHEYAEWRPASTADRNKFRGAINAPQGGVSGAINATIRKVCSAENALSQPATEPESPENREACSESLSAINALPLDNQSIGLRTEVARLAKLSKVNKLLARDRLAVELDELRKWANETVRTYGHGGQRRISKETGIPEAVISRFRGGGSLPESHRFNLQHACGRALPFDQRKELAA